LLASALTGSWWLWLFAIPLGLYLSLNFDRQGSKWRIVRA
jgi:hypothetical protein